MCWNIDKTRYIVDISAILVDNTLMKIYSRQEITKLAVQPYVKRTIEPEFVASLNRPEVTILYGPRQVGKSALLFQNMLHLWDKNGGKAEIFYYNLDVISSDFRDPDKFTQILASLRKNEAQLAYVFIDEAQRLENIGLWVKYIHDQKLNIKLVLTGSASLEIREKVREPLTGRKIEFLLLPLTLDEIFIYNGYAAAKIDSSLEITEKILEEYLMYGGYPGVFVEPDSMLKKKKLTEIADSYVTRDVANLFGIKNTDTVRLIASFLGENIGGLLSRENVSKLAGVSKYETEKILGALEKTFIILKILPFAKGGVRELIHRPKVYFFDVGIRNALLAKLESYLLVADRGKLFENAIALRLFSKFGLSSIRFWRTSNQTEVDFIVKKQEKIIAYECKNTSSKSSITKGLYNFQKLYSELIENVFMVTKENYWKV